MKKKINGHQPFSIEVKIKDEKGHKIFHWHEAQNNLVLGMMKTGEFVSVKLGIEDNNIEEHWINKDTEKQIGKIIEKNFGVITKRKKVS